MNWLAGVAVAASLFGLSAHWIITNKKPFDCSPTVVFETEAQCLASFNKAFCDKIINIDYKNKRYDAIFVATSNFDNSKKVEPVYLRDNQLYQRGKKRKPVTIGIKPTCDANGNQISRK